MKKMKGIFAKHFARNYESKNITWNIRHLVNETIVPSTKLHTMIEDCHISIRTTVNGRNSTTA